MAESTTIQLHDRRAFRRELKRLELEYDTLWDAQVADVHTAIVRVGIENPDLLLDTVNEIQHEGPIYKTI
ncbi:hypothetical protein [Natronosalvus caseinilyticus]|uniref:hypothetical protein n=1 Tax=Natronosalvus caseinilyticus TaxID=2953747 RepID=UPI0028B05A8C|nr:hypothetical protein [Natronosalvus caseinilyticus]